MNDTTFGSGWLPVLVILLVLFGMGGGGFGLGNNAAFATMADVNSAINNQSVQQSLNSALLSSANNNYETAQLINQQSMAQMNQSNTNLLAAINGFNAVNQSLASNFATVNQNLADLGYRMDRCCCEIKTQMLENRLADANAALVSSQTANAIAAQSQYLLSQLGTYTPAAVV